MGKFIEHITLVSKNLQNNFNDFDPLDGVEVIGFMPHYLENEATLPPSYNSSDTVISRSKLRGSFINLKDSSGTQVLTEMCLDVAVAASLTDKGFFYLENPTPISKALSNIVTSQSVTLNTNEYYMITFKIRRKH